MKFPENRKAIETLPIDIFGFIFYAPSKRFVGTTESLDFPDLVKTPKQKAGIFVNETIEKIIEIAGKASLTFVQLHGEESPGFCKILREKGLKVIKAFAVNEHFDFNATNAWEEAADFFLFDTRSEIPGGSGKKFNWELLTRYNGNTPFFLSGGLRPEDSERIRNLLHPRLYGIDLNSGFEDYPGYKNISLLKQFFSDVQK